MTFTCAALANLEDKDWISRFYLQESVHSLFLLTEMYCQQSNVLFKRNLKAWNKTQILQNRIGSDKLYSLFYLFECVLSEHMLMYFARNMFSTNYSCYRQILLQKRFLHITHCLPQREVSIAKQPCQ